MGRKWRYEGVEGWRGKGVDRRRRVEWRVREGGEGRE